MWLRSLPEQTLTGVKRAQRVTLVKPFMQHTIILSSFAIIAIFCPIVYYFIEPPAATWSAAVEWAATTMSRAIWQEILNLTQVGLGVGQGVLQSARTLVTALASTYVSLVQTVLSYVASEAWNFITDVSGSALQILRDIAHHGQVAVWDDLLALIMDGLNRLQVRRIIDNVVWGWTEPIRVLATEAIDLYATALYDFWRWTVAWIGWFVYGWMVDTYLWTREVSIEKACHWMPEGWWTLQAIQHWECERRVRPWRWWIKQMLARIITGSTIVGFIIGWCMYKFVHWTRTYMFTRSELRMIRWGVLWMKGRDVEETVFRPKAPAGDQDGKRWTTDERGYLHFWDQEKYSCVSPLPVVNRTLKLLGLPASLTSVRNGDYVTYTWRPLPILQWLPYPRFTPWAQWPAPEIGKHIIRIETDGVETVAACCKAGTHTALMVPVRVWDTLINALECHNKDTQPYTIGTVVRRFLPEATQAQLTIIQSLMAAKWNSARAPVVAPEESLPEQTIEFVGDERDDPEAPWRPTGRAVMPALCTEPDSMPVKGKQNSLSAVHYRLDCCRNPITKYPVKVFEWAGEFCDRTARRQIEPWSLDAVLEHQDGPLQKLRNELAKWQCFQWTKAEVKAMIKIEALANHNFVRNISTLPAEFNLSLGRYMLAAAEELKANHDWYGAGRTPRNIAWRIAEMAHEARRNERNERMLCAADVSKMDAAKSPYLTAWLTTRLYCRMFGMEEDEMIRLRMEEATCPAKTAEGDAYGIGASQLSGSASTTIDNTVTNAFISYVAHRLEGYSADDAFKALGVYVGDDSVSHNTAATVEEAGRLLGYKIVAEMIGEGEDIPFLSRYFYDAWEGGPNSVQDPVRLLRKIHISLAPRNISPQKAAADKLRGLTELDPAVKLYRALHATVVRITGEAGDKLAGLGYMQRAFVEAGGWPTCNTANDKWAQYTNFEPSVYIQWAKGVRTWTDFMRGPPCLVQTESARKCLLAVDPYGLSDVLPAEATVGPPPPNATVALPAEQVVSVVEERNKSVKEEMGEMIKEERRSRARFRKARPRAPRPAFPQVGVWKAPDEE